METQKKHEHPVDKMRAIAEWLGWQEENLSYGLRSIADAEKLYDYWQANPDLPEMADVLFDDDGDEVAPHRIKALGYDPLA